MPLCSHRARSDLAQASIVALFAAVTFGCSEAPPHQNDELFAPVEGGVEYEAEYLLVDALGTMIADPEPDEKKPLSVPSYEIGKDERRVLFQHPESEYRFPGVPGGPGRRLLVAPAMHPKSWETRSDGAGFEVECLDAEGRRVTLLELEIAPALEPADRIWHDREIPLDDCSAPATELSLRTTCGPRRNCGADWAAWANPRVRYVRAIAPRPSQLALLISIDTLRPDHLSLYGYARDTSPALERLAQDAIVFETAVSASPWTIPSHATMLTSTYPDVHQASAFKPIHEAAVSIGTVLSDEGWQTAGFVDTPYMGREHGFERGFEHFDDDDPAPGNHRRGGRVVRQRLLSWLARADTRPAFVLWHIMDAHGPYGAPAPFAGRYRSTVDARPDDPRFAEMRKLSYHDYLHLERFDSFEDLVATYDEGIRHVDDMVGELIGVLRTAGLYDDALIVVTSDHGESFLDHDVWVGHGLFLTDDEIRVPLIVKLPENRHAGTRTQSLVSLIDVAPTILEALDLPPHAAFQGENLLALTDPDAAPRTAFGESNNTGARFVRTQKWKYISGQDPKKLANHLRYAEGAAPRAPFPPELLHDLENDPRELEPRTGAEEEVGRFSRLIAEHAKRSEERRAGWDSVEPVPVLSEENQQRLRELGYVE